MKFHVASLPSAALRFAVTAILAVPCFAAVVDPVSVDRCGLVV